MGEPAIPAAAPNDHLNRRLLHRMVGHDRAVAALLEQLCTDSVYVMKDEFDHGIDPFRWVNGGFVWDSENMAGRIYGSSLAEPDEDRPHAGLSLRNRVFGWRAAKRATAIIRLKLSGLSGKIEFGFVGEGVVNVSTGVILNGSGPVGQPAVRDYTVAVRDASNSALYGLVTRGVDAGNTLGAGTREKTVAITGDYHTLMIATNEQAESRLWVDGMPTDVERSGPGRNAALSIWLHAESNSLDVDYIQAWQERTALIA